MHSHQRRFGQLPIGFWVGLLAIAIVVVGCSRLKSDKSPATGGSSSNSSSSTSTPAAPASAAGTPTSWETNATSLNGQDGQTMTLTCSPGGQSHTVWGSDIYTSDSSICTAAVHSGLITFEKGGTVTIELRAGRSIYGASERNGVTTSTYGAWQHSFVFKTPNTDAVVRAADEATPLLWNSNAGMVNFEVGKTIKFSCPANGKEASAWGTDTYTIDSSICTAGVHAGKIQLEGGGSVTIEMRPGESSYKGSTRNGIKTNDYGQYGSSFIVK